MKRAGKFALYASPQQRHIKVGWMLGTIVIVAGAVTGVLLFGVQVPALRLLKPAEARYKIVG